MNTMIPTTSACRYCRFYTPEGRRGGICEQLGVSVRGCWNACALALPPFAPSWESAETILSWKTSENLAVDDLAKSKDYDYKSHLITSETEKITVREKQTAILSA